MSKNLFLRITEDLESAYDYFKQKPDARGCLGFTAIQKVTSAIRVLAYGNTYDINDEYLKMAEKTTRDTLEYFCYGIYKYTFDFFIYTYTWYIFFIYTFDFFRYMPIIWKKILEKPDMERPSTTI
jgi:hypothetical protein